jgi:phosphatidylglycerophosphate synthase
VRSAYEQRDLSLKTSYLAKAKTWTQMQGIGMMLLFPLVGDRPFLTILLAAGVALPLILMAGLWFTRKKFWRGALWMSGSFAGLLALNLNHDVKFALYVMMGAVVGITWVSGIDYVVMGWRQLRGRGDFGRADAVRILGAITVPSLLFAVLVETPTPAWPIFTILAFELAVGGLDNILSHHKKATKALAWGGRVLGVSVLLAAALLLPAQATIFTIAAAAGSVFGVCAEFWRGRDYFMDKRIRDKALREAAADAS